ncbi:MAG: TIGR02757 family protein [Marinifilaceae bacterium]|jgi:uncharacterized protein (TIGR02757 family)
MEGLTPIELKEFLEEKFDLYNRESFIQTDPIQIPRAFSRKEDIEIAGFLAASIAWGQRPTIIRNGRWLMEQMNHQPYQFLMDATEDDLQKFSGFKHRTFNGEDCVFFLKSLRNIYQNHNGLEGVFLTGLELGEGMKGALAYFRKIFFEIEHQQRTTKHVSNVEKKSSAKRLNMFLRWMIRSDQRGVDFGLWKGISPAELYIPLDVHSGRIARKLGLLQRKQDDWPAVEELTQNLRAFDPTDPIKYDYALFGIGAFEKF